MLLVASEWQRVADYVRKRRESLGLTQEQAAADSGGMVSSSNWRVVEAASRSTFRRPTLLGVCRVLGWTDDSIDRLLRGDEPNLSDRKGMQVAAAGVDLAELARLDPDTHEHLMSLARLALERAKDRGDN